MQQQYIERVVDLTEPEANQLYKVTVEEARALWDGGGVWAWGATLVAAPEMVVVWARPAVAATSTAAAATARPARSGICLP